MEARSLRRHETAPTDARQVRSRKALGTAMLELLVEVPFDQLTIREISARAGTGYATFFRHYPDKETLLGDIASQEIATLLDMTLPLLDLASSAASVRALCRYVARHRQLWSALLTGGAASVLRAEFIRQARLLPLALGKSDSWLPDDLAVVHATGATVDLLAWWLAQEEPHSADEIARILDQLIIAPTIGRQAGASRHFV